MRTLPPLTFMFNPLEYLCDRDTCMMTLEEEGRQWRSIMSAARNRDFHLLSELPFVEKVFKGSLRPWRVAIPAAVRRRVLSVGQCAYCRSRDRLQVDHIHPYSKKGAHDASNFQCLCRRCNLSKAAKIPSK